MKQEKGDLLHETAVDPSRRPGLRRGQPDGKGAAGGGAFGRAHRAHGHLGILRLHHGQGAGHRAAHA